MMLESEEAQVTFCQKCSRCSSPWLTFHRGRRRDVGHPVRQAGGSSLLRELRADVVLRVRVLLGSHEC